MNASTLSTASHPAYPQILRASRSLAFGHNGHQHDPDCPGDTCTLKHPEPKTESPAHGEPGHVHGPDCSHGHHHDHADHAPPVQKPSRQNERKGVLGWLGNLWQGVLGFFKDLFSGFFKDVKHLTAAEKPAASHDHEHDHHHHNHQHHNHDHNQCNHPEHKH